MSSARHDIPLLDVQPRGSEWLYRSMLQYIKATPASVSGVRVARGSIRADVDVVVVFQPSVGHLSVRLFTVRVPNQYVGIRCDDSR